MKLLYRAGRGLTYVLGLCFLLQVLAGSLYYRVFITLDYVEAPIYYRNSWPILLETAMLAAVLFLLRKPLLKVSEKALFAGLSVVFLLAGTVLIFSMNPGVHGDPEMIYDYVAVFNAGDYHGFEPGYYMNFFPYQAGLLSFERILSRISYDLRFYFGVNLALMWLTHFFQWRTAKILFAGRDLAVRYTVVLSFAFLPMLFFLFWVYGQIPGFSMLLGAFWLFTAFLRDRKPWQLIVCGLFSALACQLKQNMMVGVLAMACVLILYFLREKKPVHLGAIALIFACVFLAGRGVTAWYEAESGLKIGKGSPTIAFVAMGLQEASEDSQRAPGWYNGYIYDSYAEHDCDTEATAEAAREYLKKRLPELAQNPGYTAVFFRDKLVAAWCDPLFQSVWSGPTEAEGMPQTTNPILANLYRGGRVYEAAEAWMNALNILIYAGAACWILLSFREKEGREETLFYLIFFIGGFLFHAVSEIKGQYLYFYVYSLIPLAASVLAQAASALGKDTKQA